MAKSIKSIKPTANFIGSTASVNTGLKALDDIVGPLSPGSSITFSGDKSETADLILQLADALAAEKKVLYLTDQNAQAVKHAYDRLGLVNEFLIADSPIVKDTTGGLLKEVIETGAEILVVDDLRHLDDGKYKDGYRTGKTPGRVYERLSAYLITLSGVSGLAAKGKGAAYGRKVNDVSSVFGNITKAGSDYVIKVTKSQAGATGTFRLTCGENGFASKKTAAAPRAKVPAGSPKTVADIIAVAETEATPEPAKASTQVEDDEVSEAEETKSPTTLADLLAMAPALEEDEPVFEELVDAEPEAVAEEPEFTAEDETWEPEVEEVIPATDDDLEALILAQAADDEDVWEEDGEEESYEADPVDEVSGELSWAEDEDDNDSFLNDLDELNED